MTDINVENKRIESEMKKIAKSLFKEDQVDLLIGYTKGTVPFNISPIFIKREDEIDNLIWNNLCYINLATYLTSPLNKVINETSKDLRVGIISKGCVARSLIHLAKEKQVDLDNLKIIGIPCNGIINRQRILKEIGEKEILDILIKDNQIVVKGVDFQKTFPYKEYLNELCKTCQIKAPPFSEALADVILGESQKEFEIDNNFSDLYEFESKNPDEKWEEIKDLLQNCTRCYACREACPLCYCALCFVDQNVPRWFNKTPELSDIIIFHIVRALHLAGRCVGCGACSSACPMGIDLSIVNRKLEKIVKKRFDFMSGLNLETMPPMMTQSMKDQQEFMLEEE
ncbi:MAG: 4Fe-4S ferredoxin [Candidatus Lokiarchaeota archaeon]|nr:4Fe-4S ferredoxin [Candidatus Lokiarchaeota archaeon]MBD3337926.1 4Fe-4S ferredoxin [Candidatus Lokiarchaeota archaeon]